MLKFSRFRLKIHHDHRVKKSLLALRFLQLDNLRRKGFSEGKKIKKRERNEEIGAQIKKK